jgi:ankyrin repeat protein
MEIDTSYVNQYGNTLLMSVVMSYLPLDWKLTTSRKLIESGVDINHTNDYSKSALDLAKQKQEEQLVKLLSPN